MSTKRGRATEPEEDAKFVAKRGKKSSAHSLLALPRDLLVLILTFLPTQTHFSIRAVCRILQTVASLPASFPHTLEIRAVEGSPIDPFPSRRIPYLPKGYGPSRLFVYGEPCMLDHLLQLPVQRVEYMHFIEIYSSYDGWSHAPPAADLWLWKATSLTSLDYQCASQDSLQLFANRLANAKCDLSLRKLSLSACNTGPWWTNMNQAAMFDLVRAKSLANLETLKLHDYIHETTVQDILSTLPKLRHLEIAMFVGTGSLVAETLTRLQQLEHFGFECARESERGDLERHLLSLPKETFRGLKSFKLGGFERVTVTWRFLVHLCSSPSLRSLRILGWERLTAKEEKDAAEENKDIDPLLVQHCRAGLETLVLGPARNLVESCLQRVPQMGQNLRLLRTGKSLDFNKDTCHYIAKHCPKLQILFLTMDILDKEICLLSTLPELTALNVRRITEDDDDETVGERRPTVQSLVALSALPRLKHLSIDLKHLRGTSEWQKFKEEVLFARNISFDHTGEMDRRLYAEEDDFERKRDIHVNIPVPE